MRQLSVPKAVATSYQLPVELVTVPSMRVMSLLFVVVTAGYKITKGLDLGCGLIHYLLGEIALYVRCKIFVEGLDTRAHGIACPYECVEEE